MNTTGYFLKKIETIDASSLRTMIINDHVVIDKSCIFSSLDTQELISLEQTDKIEGKVKLYTIKCTTILLGEISRTHPQCFLLTSVFGEQFLLGTERRPFPTYSITDNFPQNVSGKACSSLAITYISTIPLLKVIL